MSTAKRPVRRARKNKRIRNVLFAAVAFLLILTIGLLISKLKGDQEPEQTTQPAWPLQYEETVTKYSDRFHVPMYVIYATIRAESGFNPQAKSSVGAVGLMQVMPATYEWLCGRGHLNEEYQPEKLTEPDTNIRVGTYYLSWLYSVFGDWELVSAAYNAGHGKVKQWMNDPEVYIDGKLVNIPYDETRNYVKKVLSYEESYKKMYADRNWKDYDDTVIQQTDTSASSSASADAGGK